MKRKDAVGFLDNALTVEELISELEGYPPGARVVMSCDYGDHCHTQQALSIRGIEQVDSSRIESSGYSHSGFAVSDADEDEDEDEDEGDDEPETPAAGNGDEDKQDDGVVVLRDTQI